MKKRQTTFYLLNGSFGDVVATDTSPIPLIEEAERLNEAHRKAVFEKLDAEPKGKGRPRKLEVSELNPYFIGANSGVNTFPREFERAIDAFEARRAKAITRNPSPQYRLENQVALALAKRLDRAYYEIGWNALSKTEQAVVQQFPEIFEVSRNLNTGGKFVSLTDANYRDMLTRKNGLLDSQGETFNSEKLDTLSAEFQGQITGEQFEAIASNLAPKELARLGQLKLIRTKNGQDLSFKGDAWLCADARRNLWIVGKSAKVRGVKNSKEQGLSVIGEIEQIDYVTDKQHIEEGRLTHFYHELGEVDGQHPVLAIDNEGFPLILGGNYDILNVGIVN